MKRPIKRWLRVSRILVAIQVSYDYADDKFGGVDSGNMGPANKFRYTVSLVEDEGWKITKQVLLEQNK